MKRITWISCLLSIVVISLFLFSCQKDDEIALANSADEILSEEEVAILDDLPEAVHFTSESILLPNGETLDSYVNEVDPSFYDQWLRNDPFDNLGPQDARNLLIARISAIALHLTDRSKYQKPDEGINKPSQDGLAYGWGSKDHQVRQSPKGDGTLCGEEIFGLDCSGFIHQVFKQANVTLLSGPSDEQRKPSVLQNAIGASIPALNNVKVEDLGEIPIEDFQTGDIIYWMKPNKVAFHIGIVLRDFNGNLAVFQSNGSIGRSPEDCTKNRGQTRGARKIALHDPYWFGAGKKYGITRINADISGRWSLYLRCEFETEDAIVLKLDFPTTSSSSFNISGAGTDYSGEPIKCTGEMFYNKVTNVLSGTLLITSPSSSDFYRYDSFSVKLARDETGYFNLELGDNVDAGCPVEGRLVNNE